MRVGGHWDNFVYLGLLYQNLFRGAFTATISVTYHSKNISFKASWSIKWQMDVKILSKKCFLTEKMLIWVDKPVLKYSESKFLKFLWSSQIIYSYFLSWWVFIEYFVSAVFNAVFFAVIVAVAVFGSTQLDTNSIFYFFLVQLKCSCPSDVFEKL